MTGHTARGIPYALPTDALIDYPAASLELANLIEKIEVVGYVEQAATITVTATSEEIGRAHV